ncbi:hypothetical protein TNCV_4892971 [Trichonephila clavipes]|nr:hypothetical protein TNCV_4892971 [Trichonephila clavipes]
MNSTCVAKSGSTANRWRNTIVKNRHVADGRLLPRHAPTAHDRVEGFRFPTLAKPSCGSHLRRRLIQSVCSSLVSTQIHVARALQVPVSSHSWYALCLASP